MDLKQRILELAGNPPKEEPQNFRELFHEFLQALEKGEIRSAEKVDGRWIVNSWVKQGILLGFKYGENRAYDTESALHFFDKHTYPTQKIDGVEKNIRIVPGGSSVRSGCYVGENVTMMPPMYINAGAYVGENTMLDSHVLVGSCAQIGSGVHLSAGAQIGGVLEPIGAMPVVVEDNCLVGGNTGIYEGTQVGAGAVIGAGVVLVRSTPVYDLVNECVYRGGHNEPLQIPKNAVVVPGSRPIKNHKYAESIGLHISTPVIIKYRDDKTDAATTLEHLLR
ncbi:MAG TPA: 2,3,4,5-tetrahydropyridine-2,6-dicarboxylate N-succinyltransferase [Balneolales bacterium]|nr:2,3,4,5-tetrahydropyridine-2,6-dicarboxylate N-succinyltransferase [Balneolales bacterium]